MKTFIKTTTIIITSLISTLSFAGNFPCNNISIDNMQFLGSEGNQCLFYRLQNSKVDPKGKTLVLTTITNGKKVEMQALATVCGSDTVGYGEKILVTEDMDKNLKDIDTNSLLRNRTVKSYDEKVTMSGSPQKKIYDFMCQWKNINS